MIEDLLQICASRDLARLILEDLIRQKNVMMGLAKGQTVVNMGLSNSQDPIFRFSPRHYICDVVIRPFSISISLEICTFA